MKLNNKLNYEPKENLAKLLATENLEIQFRRADTASFSLDDRILTIPIYKKELDSDALDLFIAHECSHAIHTPAKGWGKIQKKMPVDIVNIVEDARIDKLMKLKYPGIVRNYKEGSNWLWKNNFFKNKGKKFSDYNIVDKFNLYFKLNELNKFSEKDYTNKEFELITEGENLKSWADVIRLSEKLNDAYNKEKEEKKEIKSKSDLDPSKIKTNKTDGSNGKLKESDNPKESDVNDRISITQSALEGSMGKNKDRDVSDPIVVNLPKPNLKNIIVTPKEFVKKMADKNHHSIYNASDKKKALKRFEFHKQAFSRFKKKSNKTVNYLVKEFEMRKQARQYKRAKTDKTGILDPIKLHTYKFNEDLFKRLIELPEDKNHGMIFLLDWSSSMSDTIFNTTKQLMNLVWFCDKVQIPFEVYAFRDINNSWGEKKEGIKWCDSEQWTYKEGDLAMNDFHLINMLSHRSSKQEFKKCMYHLYYLAERLGSRYSYYSDKPNATGFWEEYSAREQNDNKEFMDSAHFTYPDEFYLNTTPLIESLVALQHLVPAFRKKYQVDKLAVVTLTDGGANGPWDRVLRWNKKLKDYEKKYHHQFDNYDYPANYHYVVRDVNSSKKYVLNPRTDNSNDGSYQKRLRDRDANFVGVLLSMLEKKYNTDNLGFYVIPKRCTYIVDSFFDYVDHQSKKSELRKQGNLIVKEPGYEEYYLLFSPKMEVRNTDLSELDNQKDKAGDPIVLTKAKIKSVFRNSCSGKVKSRVVLNKFIEKVA